MSTLWEPVSDTAVQVGFNADLLDNNHSTAFVAGANGVTAIVSLTQAAYDALTPKVATTLYIING